MKKVIIAGVLGMALGYYIQAHKDQSAQVQESAGARKSSNLQMNKLKQQQQSANLDKLLDAFEQQTTLTNRQAVELLKVSPKTARNYFQKLVVKGCIAKEGSSGRGVYYRFIKRA